MGGRGGEFKQDQTRRGGGMDGGIYYLGYAMRTCFGKYVVG